MEARIRELEEQLRNLSLGRIKDLSLASNIKEWSGSKSRKSVREFFSQIDQFGAISQWTEADRISIVTAKCVGEAQLYIKGVEEMNEPGLMAVEIENKGKKKEVFSFRTETMKYFNCGKIGHTKRDCRSPRRDDSSKPKYASSPPRRQPPCSKSPESDERKNVNVRANVTCWRCNTPGHVAKHCRKQLRANRKGNMGDLN
ncbi:hypothetical protein Cfor_00581 [Coptotermes formosanus]|uniref:CCHC-type domain-containing protein n=1 Tax=Coptotermes formosanus TaxID=36987 RepID=A0A6L2PF75_COPFO|nr:hypothetical protein Cfor_00581 [Coptotermes formosanus]